MASADDPVAGNDSASATIVVGGGGGATVLGVAAAISGSTLALKTACPAGGTVCSGTAKLFVGRELVARGAYRIRSGATRMLRLKLRGAAVRTLARAGTARAQLVAERGGTAGARRIAVLGQPSASAAADGGGDAAGAPALRARAALRGA